MEGSASVLNVRDDTIGHCTVGSRAEGAIFKTVNGGTDSRFCIEFHVSGTAPLCPQRHYTDRGQLALIQQKGSVLITKRVQVKLMCLFETVQVVVVRPNLDKISVHGFWDLMPFVIGYTSALHFLFLS